jgi:hypothetical protein
LYQLQFQVQNEVPGSPIFMMQLCTNARYDFITNDGIIIEWGYPISS